MGISMSTVLYIVHKARLRRLRYADRTGLDTTGSGCRFAQGAAGVNCHVGRTRPGPK